MKLTEVLRKIVDGSLMMRVSNPRTVSVSVLHVVIERIEELEALAIQYRDDLRHPPSGDSIDRRVEAVNTILYDSATREKDE